MNVCAAKMISFNKDIQLVIKNDRRILLRKHYYSYNKISSYLRSLMY